MGMGLYSHMTTGKTRSTGCGSISSRKRALRNYKDVVRDYISRFRRSASVELRWFATRSDLETVVELASMCRTPDNKRHPHQRRLPQRALRAAHRRLAKCDLESCRSFDELHDLIDDEIGNLESIGELAVYDIACRIGAYLKLEPQRVYLHRGTRAGAQAIGLTGSQKTLELKDLPTAFRSLKAGEIEDCFCIYKDELREIYERQLRRGR